MLREITSLTAISLALAGPLAAQNVPVQELQTDDVFAEPFSAVVGVVELSDGRVMVADQTERALYSVDFDAGEYEQVGRNGQGPQEYQSPGPILVAPGDTVLLTDFANMRTAIVSPAGEIVRTVPARVEGSAFTRFPRGIDRQGNWYVDQAGVVSFGPGGAQGGGSTAPVLRWRPGTERADTVGMINQPEMNAHQGTIRIGGGGGVSMGGPRQAFRVRDMWATLPDGSLAIVRKDNYRVDVVSPNGRITEGTPVQYTPIRISNADKEAWADRQSQNRMTINTGSGAQTVQMPRPNLDEVEFPEYFPPFAQVTVQVTSDGSEIWVQRQLRFDETRPLYDVFNNRGQYVRQVRLPENRRLAGMGNGVAYAIHVDEDGLQWLERYEL